MDAREEAEMGFVQRRLPWLVAFGALLVYIVTLQYSATPAGIAVLAKSAGWDWHINIVAPLHVLLTYPVRWLPARAQLIALNLTAAVFAALTLALLTRSVSLLPHDRTRHQRTVEHGVFAVLGIRSAWLPPILAAMTCGLQLTFWENAVVATGEMLDLLVFAWLINCLLEYRLDRKELRLRCFAFVYGLSAVNNFAMIAFFPAFFVALAWIKGVSFFSVRFFFRMSLCGLAGLTLYLALPLAHFFNAPDGYSVWQLLEGYWSYQKRGLTSLPRYIVLLCSLTSILPVCFIGIRWPSAFGEVNAIGKQLTNYGIHLIHAAFLAGCTYVAFDPLFSPRNLSHGMSALLPFYYLGGLTIGYCSGYLLLILHAGAYRAWQSSLTLRQVVIQAVVAAIWLSAIAVPAGLFARNLPAIWTDSGQAMNRLSRATVRSLPAGAAFILSDDPFRLYALHHELLKDNPRHKHVLIDTTSFNSPEYHRFLQRTYPESWPKFHNRPQQGALIDPANLVNVLLQISQMAPIYYLHPSFGYYFEFFYAKPHQMIYELATYPTNTISGPVLTSAEIEAQDKYWVSLKAKEIDRLIDAAGPFPAPNQSRFEPPTLDAFLGGVYSRALNDFGVRVQRAGDLNRAAKYFDWAVRLNPASAAAFINRDYNARLQNGQRGEMDFTKEARRRLKAYDDRWEAILGLNGPLDEPIGCYGLARAFAKENQFRQAGQELERTLFFSPENKSVRLDYMMMCVRSRRPERVAGEISIYRARFQTNGLKDEEEMELICIEAWAKVQQDNLGAAAKMLTAAQEKHPHQRLPWDTLVDIYVQLSQETNALEVLDRQIQAQPGNVKALVNFGSLKLRTGDVEGALLSLNQALKLKPGDEDGMFNRALANMAAGRLDTAQADFQALLEAGTKSYRPQSYFGLAEIHFRKNNRAESLKYYRDFLKIAVRQTGEVELARERIKALESRAF